MTPNAEPVRVWQSVQWQIETCSGSASPSTVMKPQWHEPLIFMNAVLLQSAARSISNNGLDSFLNFFCSTALRILFLFLRHEAVRTVLAYFMKIDSAFMEN
jgi:hypothetical protein